MTDRVFTEATIEKAAGLISQRNSLVRQVEAAKDHFNNLDMATQGVLSVNGRSLSVMVTPEAFDLLTHPFTDEIEKVNNELKALGVVTVDEEMADAPAQAD